eukprot:g72018.t1
MTEAAFSVWTRANSPGQQEVNVFFYQSSAVVALLRVTSQQVFLKRVKVKDALVTNALADGDGLAGGGTPFSLTVSNVGAGKDYAYIKYTERQLPADRFEYVNLQLVAEVEYELGDGVEGLGGRRRFATVVLRGQAGGERQRSLLEVSPVTTVQTTAAHTLRGSKVYVSPDQTSTRTSTSKVVVIVSVVAGFVLLVMGVFIAFLLRKTCQLKSKSKVPVAQPSQGSITDNAKGGHAGEVIKITAGENFQLDLQARVEASATQEVIVHSRPASRQTSATQEARTVSQTAGKQISPKQAYVILSSDGANDPRRRSLIEGEVEAFDYMRPQENVELGMAPRESLIEGDMGPRKSLLEGDYEVQEEVINRPQEVIKVHSTPTSRRNSAPRSSATEAMKKIRL